MLGGQLGEFPSGSERDLQYFLHLSQGGDLDELLQQSI